MNILTWIAALACAGASAYFVYQNLLPVLRTTALGADKAFVYSSGIAFIHACFLLIVKISFL
jgi:hypothetical protein